MTQTIHLPATRFGIVSIIALSVSFLLFCLMHYLIENSNEVILDRGKSFTLPPFVRIPPVEEPPAIREPKPKEVLQPPPDLSFESLDEVSPGDYIVDIPKTEIPGPKTWDTGQIDNDAIAIVKPQPHYPEPALRKGIQGYAIVEFTVSTFGTTKDIRIIASEPGSIFDRAAIRATEKFKYKPKIVNGKAVEMIGLQNKFTFELED